MAPRRDLIRYLASFMQENAGQAIGEAVTASFAPGTAGFLLPRIRRFSDELRALLDQIESGSEPEPVVVHVPIASDVSIAAE